MTPITFHDVRKHLTVASGTASSLADVSGVGTYGPALNQATQANQPAWDGTTLNFDGSNDVLLSASAIAALDLSVNGAAFSVCLIGDIPTTPTFRPSVTIGKSDGTPLWSCFPVTATPTLRPGTDVLALGGQTTPPTPGSVHVFWTTFKYIAGTSLTVGSAVGAGTLTTNGGNVGAEESGACLLSVGQSVTGISPSALRMRALLVLPGVVTSGQQSTVLAYAQAQHGA